MPNILRIPDPPLTVQKSERLIIGPAEIFRPLVNAPGSWNACDFWFQIPASQAGTSFRLFALNGAIKVPLHAARTANEASGVWKDSGGDRWSGILFSVRSRPCDGFLVEVAHGGVASLDVSKFRMECWWDCGPYSDDAGIISVDPWNVGDPNSDRVVRFRSAPGGLPAGITVMTPGANAGARWDLIWASILTDDPNPGTWTLQTRNVDLALVTNQINGRLDAMSAPWYYQGSGWPGGTASQWEIVAPVTPGPSEFHVVAEFRRSD